MKKLTQKEFKLPNAPNFNGRKSTFAKALSDGIAPRIRPTREEFCNYKTYFKQGISKQFSCAYCGSDYDYLEHFRPLVVKSRPTGYGSDVYNLVPSCGNCNHKKKNDSWKKWMKDKNNPGILNSKEHSIRYKRLEEFENWGDQNNVAKIDFEKLVGKEKWQQYLTEFEKLISAVEDLNKIQSEIRLKVKEKLKNH